MRSVVIVPTYNEAKNISRLIKSILSLPEKLDILVVDDSSPDKTYELVLQRAKKNSRVKLLLRPKKLGLGPAYKAGFKEALSQGYNFICTMDADWSHDPKYLSQLLAQAQVSDLVLGSRYIPGGGTRNWNWGRRQISRYGNWYARKILNLPYRDVTGGFKCFNRRVLASLDLNALSSLGYNFQIETTYRAHQKNFTITEVPIIFFERNQGSSKFNLKIILESFWRVLQLRLKS